MNIYFLPIIIVFIVFYGLIKKCNIYDSFLEGCKEGFGIVINIFPSILAIIFASRIIISSGFINFLVNSFFPNFLIFPKEVIPMVIMRPISANASLSLMIDIFSKYGVDSYIGLLASTLQGCTDTSFYIISLYFGSIGIKKIKHCLFLSLIVDLIGVISSIVLVNIFLV